MKTRNGEGNERQASARRVMPLAIFLSLLGACTSPDPPQVPITRSIIADVLASVDNRTSRAMTIYLEASGATDSLGVVTGRSLRSFSLPSAAGDSMTSLRLEARARRRDPTVRSAVFHLSPGHQVVWTLDQAGTSTVTMR